MLISFGAYEGYQKIVVGQPGTVTINGTAYQQPQGAHLIITQHHVETTAGIIFLFHYLAYGSVMNVGNNANTCPAAIILTIQRPTDGVYLYNTTSTIIPSVLQPYQTGSYTFKFDSNDLGGYTGEFEAYVRLARCT